MTYELTHDIEINGIHQADIFNWMSRAKDTVNELITDHATQKTSHDAMETLIEELHDDHATSVTLGAELIADHATSVTLGAELITDHATFITVVTDIKTLLNNIRTYGLNHAKGNPKLVIDTNFDVKNSAAFDVTIAGTLYTVAVNTNCNTGTAQVITADKWSSMLISVNTSSALTGTWSATVDAATEAAAITALPATPASEVAVGYITVLTGSGVTWTAGTDALQTGTGGTVSADTNYYNIDSVGVLTAAVSSSAPATLSASNIATLSASNIATLTAAKPASGPATLSANTALTLSA